MSAFVPVLQVSLSDDELEYSSAGRTSGSGGGKGPRSSMDGKPQVGRLVLLLSEGIIVLPSAQC